MRVFIDTNLWVYRLDKRDAEKSRLAGKWLRQMAHDHEIVISTQIMIELRAVLARKLKPAWAASDIGTALQALAAFEVLSTDANMVLDAHALAVTEQISWFDALIAEAAIRSGCAVLFSEDFSHGRALGDLTVRNPFIDGSVAST